FKPCSAAAIEVAQPAIPPPTTTKSNSKDSSGLDASFDSFILHTSNSELSLGGAFLSVLKKIASHLPLNPVRSTKSISVSPSSSFIFPAYSQDHPGVTPSVSGKDSPFIANLNLPGASHFPGAQFLERTQIWYSPDS